MVISATLFDVTIDGFANNYRTRRSCRLIAVRFGSKQAVVTHSARRQSQGTSGMYEIKKGVPPPDRKRANRPTKYPWEKLAVGDSFLVPEGTLKRSSVQFATWKANRAYPDRRFATRAVDGGIRVWRIAWLTGESGTFEVEKGVPMPEPGGPDRRAKVDVGDSFLVPHGAVKPHSVRTAASKANLAYPGRRFVTSAVDDGVRVWRIS